MHAAPQRNVIRHTQIPAALGANAIAQRPHPELLTARSPGLDGSKRSVTKQASMSTNVRINLANPFELQELPGVGAREAEAIVRFRVEHGPIRDERQLASILGFVSSAALAELADFAPADSTAPEAPGA